MKSICKYLFLIISFLSFSQNNVKKHIHVKYGVIQNISEFENNLKDNNLKENEDFKKTYKEMSEAIMLSEKLISFDLISDNQTTIFYRNEILYPDGVDGLKKIFLENILHDDYFYLKNENKLLISTDFNHKKFLINCDLAVIKWEILNETKIINQFLCHKAVFYDVKTNFKYTAWFAPEINFSIGPRFCYGLPGLVLEYNAGTFSIICKSIDFQLTDDDLKKLTIPEGELITQEDYDEIIKKARESFKN